MTVILKDIVTPRSDVLEGRFQGVIQSHKVDSKEPRLENNPEEFFRITYPSSALKRALERVNEKISMKSNQGGILLVGPYGSGKTHGLISLFHIFGQPQKSKEWLKKWGINLSIPSSSKAIIISTRRYDVDLLWEPIFKLLGHEKTLPKVRRFPTVDQIEEVVGDQVCAIFIDEIENWYGSFSPETQADLIERNETFLEHLLEVANDPNRRLFVFITFLEEKEGLKKIFNRTKPVRIDVSPIGERERIVLHRLFEDADQKDVDRIEKVVKEYVDEYVDPVKIENPFQYTQSMVRAYPFHPLLLNVLTQIYEAATERQDIRGMMNVLADAVRDTYDKKDLILLKDVNENAFRGIDLQLVEKFSYDLSRVEDISYGNEILKTILIFTLNEKTRGATESDILLSVFSPTQGDTLNAIVMDLENIYGKPYYLHREDGIYLFKHDLNIFALLEKEKKRITDDDVRKKIAEIVKKDVFENKVFVHRFEEEPLGSKTKIVAVLESWGANDQLRDRLNEFFKGKEWQNTYILILPTVESLFSFEIIEKVRRLIAAEKLREQVEDKERKLQEVVSDEKKDVVEKIKRFYGYIIRWVAKDGELLPRLINVSADINAVREKAGSDTQLVADYVVEHVRDRANGWKIEFLINDFKRERKFPMVLDDEVIYAAIRNLHKDKRVVVQGERGKWFIDEIPRELEPSYIVFDPKYAPSELTEGPEGGVPPGGEEGPISEGPEGEPITVERREKKLLSLRGNSPRVILSQVEVRTKESDIFKHIKVAYQFKKDLSKQEIMKLIKQLPPEEADIESEVEVWREEDEG